MANANNEVVMDPERIPEESNRAIESFALSRFVYRVDEVPATAVSTWWNIIGAIFTDEASRKRGLDALLKYAVSLYMPEHSHTIYIGAGSVGGYEPSIEEAKHRGRKALVDLQIMMAEAIANRYESSRWIGEELEHGVNRRYAFNRIVRRVKVDTETHLYVRMRQDNIEILDNVRDTLGQFQQVSQTMDAEFGRLFAKFEEVQGLVKYSLARPDMARDRSWTDMAVCVRSLREIKAAMDHVKAGVDNVNRKALKAIVLEHDRPDPPTLSKHAIAILLYGAACFILAAGMMLMNGFLTGVAVKGILFPSVARELPPRIVYDFNKGIGILTLTLLLGVMIGAVLFRGNGKDNLLQQMKLRLVEVLAPPQRSYVGELVASFVLGMLFRDAISLAIGACGGAYGDAYIDSASNEL